MTRVKEVIAVLTVMLLFSCGIWATIPREGGASGIGLMMLAFLGLFALILVTQAFPVCILAVKATVCPGEETKAERMGPAAGDIVLCSQQDD